MADLQTSLRWLTLCAGVVACRGAAEKTSATRAAAGATAATNPSPSKSRVEAEKDSPSPRASVAPRPDVTVSPRGSGEGPFLLTEPFAVGPAGPAAASPLGVVLVDKKDGVHLAALKARATAPEMEPLDLPADDFAPYARAPAIVGERAYWISEGRLVRRALRGGELEVLASDARKRTRVVAAASPQGRAMAAYITQPSADGAAQGKLWIEPDQLLPLTEEGSGTSSIAIAALGNHYLISSLDGRSGMTPLHARTLSFEGSQARLGPDVVAWVGASAQATTEIFSTELNGQAWAFVPIERDMSHFGLAQLQLGNTPRLDAPVHFLTYPNGTNSAPAAAGKLCDQPVVIYAAPETAGPKSSQLLLLSVLGPDGLGAADVVAKRGHFSEVSLAPLQNAALIVYTASKKTWAVTARCRPTRR